jgi:hypothetical protein
MRYEQIRSFNRKVNVFPHLHWYPVCRLNNENLKSLIGHVILRPRYRQTIKFNFKCNEDIEVDFVELHSYTELNG